MTPAAHRAAMQARLFSQYCRDAAALWEQFQQEFVLVEKGLYDDQPEPPLNETPKDTK